MKKSISTLVASLSILMMVTGCDVSIRSGHELSQEDIYGLVNSLAGGEPNTTVALFTRDAVILPPDHPEIKGTEAIRAFYVGYMGYVKRDYSFRAQSHATEVGPDLAVNHGVYTVRNIAVGQDVETGKYMNVFRRVGGKWKLWRAMWSPNAPVQSVLGYSPPR